MSTRLPLELWADVTRSARKRRQTVSEVTREALERWLLASEHDEDRDIADERRLIRERRLQREQREERQAAADHARRSRKRAFKGL